MSAINYNNTLQLQSPYLYCQAAGSDGLDGLDNTKTGIHLRWDFNEGIGL